MDQGILLEETVCWLVLLQARYAWKREHEYKSYKGVLENFRNNRMFILNLWINEDIRFLLKYEGDSIQ